MKKKKKDNNNHSDTDNTNFVGTSKVFEFEELATLLQF